MHIRRLARNAVFITVAAVVMGGFSTGIAGATSVAPTSTVSVSAVASGGTILRMPQGCNAPAVCTFDVTTRGIVLLQRFPCTAPKGYGTIRNPITQILNACPTRVYYFNPTGHCLNPNSNQGGVGRFGSVNGIGVSTNRNHC